METASRAVLTGLHYVSIAAKQNNAGKQIGSVLSYYAQMKLLLRHAGLLWQQLENYLLKFS